MMDDKVQWTLDLIEKLLETGIGEPSRLDAIKSCLENGKSIYQSDREYLKGKFKELQGKQLHEVSISKSADARISDNATQGNKPRMPSENDYPLMILQSRVAKGEISTKDFDFLKRKITESDSDKVQNDIDTRLNYLITRIEKLEKKVDSGLPDNDLEGSLRDTEFQTIKLDDEAKSKVLHHLKSIR
ncbi:MAG: hypothetical protein AUH84_04890 [Thaumarchaeota archaeon 13_1_40CM_4_38_7]|nr:MAG: hypothetical protein AUH84_04890 [Thaumarchaeota archaeon 13_1_40CM_4_38_7]